MPTARGIGLGDGEAVMRPALQDLVDFYSSPLGHVARHLIALRIRSQWRDVHGLCVAGVGYATPYLRALRAEAERVIALMPRPQGVIYWPEDGRNIAAMFEEPDLPLPDNSVDCLLAAHCLEFSEDGAALLREFWRVLRPEGRLMLVLPNRKGLWARADHTPLGVGHPYSEGQITRRLEAAMLSPQASLPSLFMPPVSWRMMLHAAPAWERAGRRIWPALSGVLVIEARKELHGIIGPAEVKLRPAMARPAVVRPAMARLSERRARPRKSLARQEKDGLLAEQILPAQRQAEA
jgi:SAM-dependent methyltransferase